MGWGGFHKISVCEHSLPCNPQLQVEAVSCKEETICEHDPETSPSSLGQRSFQMDRGKMEKLFCGQMNQNVTLFLETTDAASCGLKRSGTIRLVISAKFKSRHLCLLCGRIGAPWRGPAYASGKAVWSRPHSVSVGGEPCVFQQDSAKPHTASITTARLRSRRVQVLNRPARNPDLSPTENIWRTMKRPGTVEQLESSIWQELDSIPLPKDQ